MNKKREDYLIAAADVEFVDGAITINRLARRVKSSRSATLCMAREIGLRVLTWQEQTLRRYRAAVFLLRANDRDGLVTFEALATELGVRLDSVQRFFRLRPELKKTWCVRTSQEARVERLRCAVTRLKIANPDKPVLRKQLAFEVGMTENALDLFLLRPANRYLVGELGIKYTYSGYCRRACPQTD